MHKSLVALIVLFVMSVSQHSFACECTRRPALTTAINEASMIFLGTVKSISISEDSKFYWVEFNIDKAWKGQSGIRSQVKVGTGKACGYQFSEGKRYLVFASDSAPGYTSTCGRTKLAEEAVEDIKSLGPFTPTK